MLAWSAAIINRNVLKWWVVNVTLASSAVLEPYVLILFNIGHASRLIPFKRMLDCIAFPGFCQGGKRALLKSAYILIVFLLKCNKPRIDRYYFTMTSI